MEREHILKKKNACFLNFFFFWQILESFCQSRRVCIWISKQTITDCYGDSISRVYSADADVCSRLVAHHHRTFGKKINVAIIIYYVMLVYYYLFFTFFFFFSDVDVKQSYDVLKQ